MDERRENSTTTSSGETERYDVFISYRRRNAMLARALKGSLEKRGLSVFFDDKIKNERFPERIERAIGCAKNFILVMTKGVFIHDQAGADPNDGKDWIHEELRIALRRNVHYVPVKCQDEQLDYDGLPDELRDRIKFVNVLELGDEGLFEPSVDRIVDALRDVQLRDEKKEKEEVYAEAYRVRLENDCDIDAKERRDLDRMSVELKIQPEDKIRCEENANKKYLMDLKKDAEESETRKEKVLRHLRTWKLVASVLLILLVITCTLLVWSFYKQAHNGNGESGERAKWESERKHLLAENAQMKQVAVQENLTVENMKREARREKEVAEIAQRDAENRVREAVFAREKAEKKAEGAKSKMIAAAEEAATAEAMRKEAEKRLADAKAHAEKRRAEALSAIEAERTARKDAEVKSAETAAELNLAKAKSQQLEAELNLAKEKAQQLEAEKDSLQKDLDDLRRRRNAEVRDP